MLTKRLIRKSRALVHRRQLAAHGAGTVIHPPVTFIGPARISVGRNVMIGAGSWLGAIDDGELIIGDGVRCTGNVTLSAAALRRVAERSGVRRRIHPHSFRHSFACELAREGVPLHIIQRVLGHANPGITAVYLQGISGVEVLEAIAARRAPMVPAM